jgi:hypothetical protein
MSFGTRDIEGLLQCPPPATAKCGNQSQEQENIFLISLRKLKAMNSVKYLK